METLTNVACLQYSASRIRLFASSLITSTFLILTPDDALASYCLYKIVVKFDFTLIFYMVLTNKLSCVYTDGNLLINNNRSAFAANNCQ